MVSLVADFLGIAALDAVPPETMAELIPYLLTVFVSLVLVVAVFKVISAIAKLFCDWRWFR